MAHSGRVLTVLAERHAHRRLGDRIACDGRWRRYIDVAANDHEWPGTENETIVYESQNDAPCAGRGLPQDILLPSAPFDLIARAVLVCKRGSEAHNTYVPPLDPNGVDDRDVLVVAVPPMDNYVGLKQWELTEGINDVWDVVAYEVRKFVRLLCKQNPNVLAALWLRPEDYYVVGPLGQELLQNRHMFRAKVPFFASTIGYARGQFHRMTSGEGDPKRGFMGAKRKALREKYGYDVKNAAHMVRLLEMAVEFLRAGEMIVHRPEVSAERLRAIKRGEYTLAQVQTVAGVLFAEAETAFQTSWLPEEIDMEHVNRWLTERLWRQLANFPAVEANT